MSKQPPFGDHKQSTSLSTLSYMLPMRSLINSKVKVTGEFEVVTLVYPLCFLGQVSESIMQRFTEGI